MTDDDKQLTPAPSSVPAPIYTGTQMATALTQYRDLQTALDKAMPDQLMTIQGRTFRRKGYWRAVAKAFGINVEITNEERFRTAEGDWGFMVTARASAGEAFADGDGTCMASEKRGSGATIHNVRSHAVTRAKNRAISDLCGFGEVSAEEVGEEHAPPPRQAPPSGPPQRRGGGPSEPMLKRLFAIQKEHGWSDDDVADVLAKKWGHVSRTELTRQQYDDLTNVILPAGPAREGEVVDDGQIPF